MIVEDTAHEFARDLQQALAKRPSGQRFILGIVGYPGAGKSTIAELIVHHYNQLTHSDSSVVVPMDGFHYSNEKLEELGLLPFKGIPETFDAYAFVAMLEQLRRDEGVVFAPVFDRASESVVPNAVEIGPEHRLLIVEGNYLLVKHPPWHKVRPLLDEAWFIDTTLEAVFTRLIERHVSNGRTESGAREKVASTDMPNAHLIDATKIFADKLISLKLLYDEPVA